MPESLVLGKMNPCVAMWPFLKNIELYNISKKELKEPTFNKLDEDQKAGIMKLHGNPTKIKRICPFQVK